MLLKSKLNSVSKRLILILFLFLLQSLTIRAESGELTKAYYDVVAVAIVFVVILIIIGFLYFGLEEEIKRESKLSAGFQKVKDYLVGLKPLEKEKDLMFNHAYDGIRELDNKIPPWFNFLFYGTVLFGAIYMFYYHVLSSGDIQATEYLEEVRQAEIQLAELTKSGALLDESKLTALTDAAALSSGKEIFNKNCAVCHTESGAGLVGPNLTDDYWIHGGGIKNVYAIVKEGVPAKGMISWKTQLNPRQMHEVSSYILTLRGTNPPNAKSPEGVLYVEQDTLQGM